jgi:Proteasomal ATPase OB N-terminal domain/Proteasomal ATPase OB C-terminal domain
VAAVCQPCRGVNRQNERLADTLREARDQIVALKEEVDRLTMPPSSFGIFLNACEDGTADVFTGGRKMRVNVSPAVDSDALRPGQQVVLNESLTVVIGQGYETVGEVVVLKEVLEGGDRALVISDADEERVARLAEPLRSPRCAPVTRCCSSPGPGMCTSGSPRPRSRNSSRRKCRTSSLSTCCGTCRCTLTTWANYVDRILRPQVKTSAVPSSDGQREMPQPDGGLVSRSTSLLSHRACGRHMTRGNSAHSGSACLLAAHAAVG